MTTVTEIEEAKAFEGGRFLWLHSSGDCILWETKEDSLDDDGSKAIGRWQLNRIEMEAINSIVDEWG